MTVAALFVDERQGGAYAGLDGVEAWGVTRDARTYAGPWPVVAHPPCERWGRYARGGPSARVPRQVGDDGGCFAAALEAVRLWGGALEHPAHSKAWAAFGLRRPPRCGGWVPASLWDGGWSCHVEQGAYGHPARKATWLYVRYVKLADLRWGSASGDFVRLDEGFHSAEERAAARAAGVRPRRRLSSRELAATPIPFRDLLLGIARTARVPAREAAA